MRTTKKQLEQLLKDIAELQNMPTSREEAKQRGVKKYLILDHNSIYGGYRVNLVDVETGSRGGAFGGNGCEARLSAREMEIKLRGIYTGIVEQANDEATREKLINGERDNSEEAERARHYYRSELNAINTKNHMPSLKITGFNGESTKYLALTPECKEELINWLKTF